MTIGPEPVEMEKSPFLTKNKEYVVLLVCKDAHNTEYYIQYSEDPLGGYFDSRQFIVISNYVPDNWIIKVDNEFDYLKLLPKKWDETPAFFERLHDDDPEAIALFISERDEIYKQENYLSD